MLRSLLMSGLVAAAVLASQGRAEELPFIDRHAHVERIGNWVITCSDVLREPDGKMRPFTSCALRRRLTPKTLEGGNALYLMAVYGRETIQAPVGDRYCKKQPRARLIDGVAVGNLPMPLQIELLKTGERYAEEFMPRKWPECWIVVRTAPLDGFEKAYHRFQEVARAHGALF